MQNNPSFCSWSGGKDSCLALYKAMTSGKPKYLLTMCIETGNRTRSHGLSVDIIKTQAKSLDIPLLLQNTSWEKYRDNFISKINYMKNIGINAGIFGDIDIAEHRKWIQNLCNDTQIKAHLPLWQQPRAKLLNEFLDAGFKAIIVAVNKDKLAKKYLGRKLDKDLIMEFQNLNIDPCGENGEYHTVVTDGPIFSSPINLKPGNIILRDNYWFQDFIT